MAFGLKNAFMVCFQFLQPIIKAGRREVGISFVNKRKESGSEPVSSGILPPGHLGLRSLTLPLVRQARASPRETP